MEMVGITQQELEQLKQSKELVIVDFFATWCGPCQMFYDVFSKVQKTYAGNTKIALAKVDVDKEQQAAAQSNVSGIPTVIAFKNGREVSRFSGYISENQLLAFIRGL